MPEPRRTLWSPIPTQICPSKLRCGGATARGIVIIRRAGVVSMATADILATSSLMALDTAAHKTGLRAAPTHLESLRTYAAADAKAERWRASTIQILGAELRDDPFR